MALVEADGSLVEFVAFVVHQFDFVHAGEAVAAFAAVGAVADDGKSALRYGVFDELAYGAVGQAEAVRELNAAKAAGRAAYEALEVLVRRHVAAAAVVVRFIGFSQRLPSRAA